MHRWYKQNIWDARGGRDLTIPIIRRPHQIFRPIKSGDCLDTGKDLVPLMLMGASGGEDRDTDFSGVYTAVLWAGSTLLSAALVRPFGPALAEIPLIATRPEAQVTLPTSHHACACTNVSHCFRPLDVVENSASMALEKTVPGHAGQWAGADAATRH